jgi:hypothetical protein
VEFVHEFDDTRDGALPESLDPLPLYAVAAYLEIPALMVRVAVLIAGCSASTEAACHRLAAAVVAL